MPASKAPREVVDVENLTASKAPGEIVEVNDSPVRPEGLQVDQTALHGPERTIDLSQEASPVAPLTPKALQEQQEKWKVTIDSPSFS